LIPIAGGALVPVFGPEIYSFLPFLAAGAMATSSATVVGNSLLLTRYEPKIEGSSSKVGRKTTVKPKQVEETMETMLPVYQKNSTKPYEKIVGMAIDPICGMTVDESKTQLVSEQEGHKFYFCSSNCKKSFDKDPHRYTHR
jgi:Cu+-exporting ATPase